MEDIEIQKKPDVFALADKHQEMSDLRHKNRTDKEVEKLVIDFSLSNPHLGQTQHARQLNERYSADISFVGVS